MGGASCPAHPFKPDNAMSPKKELIEQIEGLDFIVPTHIRNNEAQLRECLGLVSEPGMKQKDVDDMFPVPNNVQSTPAAAPDPSPAPMFTQAQVEEMLRNGLAQQSAEMDRKIQEALAQDRATRGQQTATPLTVHVDSSKPDKPVNWDSRQATSEDYMREPFRVFHSGHRHSFDRFLIDGRLVEPPFSRIVVFDTYQGPETQGFGAAQNLVHLCMHETHSKTVRDMFMSDARMGGEFWTTTDRVIDEELELSMLVTSIAKMIEVYPHPQIKQMAEERGLQVGQIDHMRAKIALHDGRETLKQRKAMRADQEAQKQREALLVPNG